MIDNSLSENRRRVITGLRWTQTSGTGSWKVVGELVHSFKPLRELKHSRSLLLLPWLYCTQAKSSKFNKHLGEPVPRMKDVAYMGWNNWPLSLKWCDSCILSSWEYLLLVPCLPTGKTLSHSCLICNTTKWWPTSRKCHKSSVWPCPSARS